MSSKQFKASILYYFIIFYHILSYFIYLSLHLSERERERVTCQTDMCRYMRIPDNRGYACPLLYAYTSVIMYVRMQSGKGDGILFFGPMATLRIESLMSSKPLELRSQKHRPAETYNWVNNYSMIQRLVMGQNYQLPKMDISRCRVHTKMKQSGGSIGWLTVCFQMHLGVRNPNWHTTMQVNVHCPGTGHGAFCLFHYAQKSPCGEIKAREGIHWRVSWLFCNTGSLMEP